MSVGGEERVDYGQYDTPPKYCSWCGSLCGYEESESSEYDYVDGTVYLCYVDRQYVTVANLQVSGQLAIDKAARDAAFKAYIDDAINPELSDLLDYPWYILIPFLSPWIVKIILGVLRL